MAVILLLFRTCSTQSFLQFFSSADAVPFMKCFGCFYIFSDSSNFEEMAVLRGFQAIAENDIAKFHQFKDVGMNMSAEKYGISPLEFAGAVSSTTFVTELLEQEFSLCSSHSIASPLHFATAFGRADMVNCFISRGHDP